MLYWRYVFFFFAVMEFGVGVIVLQMSPADIDTIHGQAGVIQAPAMFYVKSFGNAVIGLGILSLWTFFKNNLVLRQGCAIAFAAFNTLATYACLAPQQQAKIYISGGYGHLVFAVLFSVMAVIFFREKEYNERHYSHKIH